MYAQPMSQQQLHDLYGCRAGLGRCDAAGNAHTRKKHIVAASGVAWPYVCDKTPRRAATSAAIAATVASLSPVSWTRGGWDAMQCRATKQRSFWATPKWSDKEAASETCAHSHRDSPPIAKKCHAQAYHGHQCVALLSCDHLVCGRSHHISDQCFDLSTTAARRW